MDTVRIGIVVISDKAASGRRADRCEPALTGILAGLDAEVISCRIVPDEVEAIQQAVAGAVDGGADLVVTAGGTGIGPRDVTPEAVSPLLEKQLPGIPELLRVRGAEKKATAVLSRAVAGTRGCAMVITLPGNPDGAAKSLSLVWPAIPHAIEVLRGESHECAGEL